MLDRIRRAYRLLSGKSVSTYYPDLRSRDHIVGTGIIDVTTTAIENYVGYATLYRSYVWVHKAVSVIANNIAPLTVQVTTGNKQAIPAHPISLLLNHGNDSNDPAKLWAVCMVYKLLGGEYFLEEVPNANGYPVALWVRRPDQVIVYPDATRPFYPTPVEYEVIGMHERIPASQMIHDPFINPLSVWRGLSPVSAALSGIKLDIFSQAHSLNFVKNAARPDYAITTEESLTPDERTRLEQRITDKYAGPEGWNRPMVLEAGQGIQVLSFPPKDTEGLAQREVSRDEVGAAFGVPDILMGFGNDSYDTEEKRRGAEAALWTLTLLPLVQRRDAVLTWHYQRRGLLKPGEQITTDLSGVSVLQEDILPKLEAATKLWAMGVPYNTIEERLRLGTGPIASGATGYLPSSVVPADMVPPLPTVTRSIVTKASARKTAEALRRIKLEMATRMERDLTKAFADLAATVARRASKAAVPYHQNGSVITKAPLPKATDLLTADDMDAVFGIFKRYALDISHASWETWNTQLGVDLAFDPADPAVVAAIKQSGDRITGITDTTLQSIQDRLGYAAEHDWSIDQFVSGADGVPGLRDMIEATYANRARTIARTELTYAQATATVGRFQDVGVSKVTILDGGSEDSDDICNQLNGTVQTLGWYAANPIQHPNCVRTAAPHFD